MRTLSPVSFVLCMLFASSLLLGANATAADEPPAGKVDEPSAGKIYELRTYHASPGKMEALHARFRDNTCKLFQKHGMELIGFWTPTEGEEAKNTLVYIVAFPSLEAQKKAWQEFRADPEWIKVKAESEKDGSLTTKVESKNLKATDYSPLR